MTNNEVLEIITNKIISMKKITDISISMTFKEDLGFDSVDMLEMILYLEEQCHVSFADSFTVLTVKDAIDFVISHQK